MNRILLALSVLTLSSVVAQTTTAALPQPTTVTFDGKAVRALTYQGQRYVGVDDLRAAGLNGGAQSLYLFTAPRPATPAYATSGCIGSLLNNGAALLRVKPLVLDNVNAQPLWRIDFEFQAQRAKLDSVYGPYGPRVEVTMSNGDRLQPGRTVYGNVDSSLTLAEVGQLSSGEVLMYRTAPATERDRPVKITLLAVRVGSTTYPAFTVDLTCTK
jgi:hypothetical protein